MRNSQIFDKELEGITKLAAYIAQVPIAFVCTFELDSLFIRYAFGEGVPEIIPNHQVLENLRSSNTVYEFNETLSEGSFLRTHFESLNTFNELFFSGICFKTDSEKPFGALCILDIKQRLLTDEQKDAIKILSEQLSAGFEKRTKNDHLKSGIKRVLEKRFAKLGYYHNAILNGTDYSVIFTDNSGIIRGFNAGAEKILGYKASEVVDKISLLAFHLEPEINRFLASKNLADASTFQNYSRKATSGHTDINEWTFVRKNLSQFLVRLSLKVIQSEQKENIGYLAIAEDITERKRAEEDLKRAKLIAEKSNQAKDLFLANMSHEIRTPMNAIIGCTDILWANDLNPDQRECVEAIKSAGQNLLGIINDILDFSKIESGKLVLEKTPFYIKEAVLNTCSLLKIKAREKNLMLNLFIDSFLPDSVCGDQVRLNQILYNLIGNAIKFTERGEVFVSLALIKDNETSCEIKFTIKDTGIGIPADKIKAVFERFTQASDETTRKYGGTGLGLSISKNLIEMYGGTLLLTSELNKGSEFSFCISFDKVGSESGIQKRKEATNDTPIGKIKILLVEDNELNQKLAKRVLTGFGFDMDIAVNGKIALEKLKLENFDLILMDLQMPEMDGYQATQEIRKSLKLNLPIMAMTAHSLVGEKDKCIEMGMNDYISKPFNAIDLQFKIHQLILNGPSKNGALTSQNSGTDELNLNRLRELSGGDEYFELEMTELFIKNTSRDMNLMGFEVQNGNDENVKRIAHGLKSTVSIFGLDKMSSKLTEIEIMESGSEGMKRLYGEVLYGWEAILPRLKERLNKNIS